MRWPVTLLLLVMACTEHGRGGGDAWDVQEILLAEASCRTDCVPVEAQDQCIVDLLTRMDQVRENLTANDEVQCLMCMRVKTELMPQIEANGCEPTADITAQIVAACGDQDAACSVF